MKHAGPEALDQLEPILEEIRRLGGLKEKKRGSFQCGSSGFLHFHEDPAGFFADLKIGDDYERFADQFQNADAEVFAARRRRAQVREERSLDLRRDGRRSAAARGGFSGPARWR